MDSDAAVWFAIASLALSCLSLGWQVATWLMSTGKPKATLVYGVHQASGLPNAPVGDSGEPPFDPNELYRQGVVGQTVIGIQVVNHGRAPVTIVRVDLRARGGKASYTPTGNQIGDAIPCRIEPGAMATFFLPVVHAEQVLLAEELLKTQVAGVYMTSRTATGKAIETPQTLRRWHS